MTAVFCDVVGSTPLGERLDPEMLHAVLGEYFAAMREVAESHGGRVSKFIGDAVVAVFGVPQLHEDDALRAVRAADEMRARLTALNTSLRTRWDVELETRMGVCTGEGSPARTTTSSSESHEHGGAARAGGGARGDLGRRRDIRPGTRCGGG